MILESLKTLLAARNSRRDPLRPKTRRRNAALRPLVEGLERKLLLTTNSWALTTGGDWDTISNWSLGHVPTSSEDAVINLTNGGTIYHDSAVNDLAHSLNINSSTILKLDSGSIALGSGNSSVASTTVASGATLSVAANATFLLQGGQTLTDNGAVNFASGDSFEVGGGYYAATPVVVNGTMTTSANDTVATYNGQPGQNTYLYVSSGGELKASGTAFNLNSMTLAAGSVLNSGDLSNDAFNLPIYVPASDVALLAQNQQFQDVNILTTELASGTLALNVMGTASTSSLRYVFPYGYKVDAGATVNVGPSVTVLLSGAQTLTDNGAVNFASGDSFEVGGGYYAATPVVVNGTMTTSANDTVATYNGQPGQNTYLYVSSGGELKASGTAFNLNSMTLAAGSVLNSGDLSNDAFNLPIYVPASDVALLAQNQQFQDVNILTTELASGTLALNVMGTASTSSLRYVFPYGYKVDAGATVNVGPSVTVLLSGAQTLTDNGAVNFASGDSFEVGGGYYAATPVVVNGTMTTSANDTVATYNGQPGQNTYLYVSSGGELKASGTAFNLNSMTLAAGSVLNSGDLSNDAFNLPIYVPASDVALLAQNQQFQDVNILTTELASGTLALNVMGTASTSSLRYVFPYGYKVDAGATVNVGPSVTVLLSGAQTLTDNGAVNFASGDSFEVGGGYYAATPVVVNGTMTTSANDTVATYNGQPGQNTYLYVSSGGVFTAIGTYFGLNSVNLSSGSTDNLHADILNNQLYVATGGTLNVTGNDFTGLYKSSSTYGVIASGDSSMTIHLENNYWGTTVSSQISSKIDDHSISASLPTVSFTPDLAYAPSAVTGLVFNDGNADGSLDNGEAGSGGARLYIDVNGDGSYEYGEPTTFSAYNSASNPTLNVQGQYRFDGLTQGIYLVREVPPAGTVITDPSSAASTVNFDSTPAGTSNFTSGAATFSGGTVANPGASKLLASGSQAYIPPAPSQGSAEVDFSQPVTTATFFYVHDGGTYAAGTATAYGYNSNQPYSETVLGYVNSKLATTQGDPANVVTLHFAQPITKITFSGGVVDNLSFTPAAGDPAYILRVTMTGVTIPNVNFGDVLSTGSATFAGTNTTTQGNWKTFSGLDGSSIANETPTNPSYVTPTISGDLTYTWAASTNDARALQQTATSASNIASCWYTDDTMTFDLNITDGKTHSVSLYALDWDGLNRSERIDVVDPATGNVLNSQSISNFTGGEYLTWQLGGHVQLRVTRTGGMNAVVSGIFFGAPLAPPNSAAFKGADTATQGNWKGVYGPDGDNVLNDSVNYPSYAAVTPSGQSSYTWASSTNDARALQRASTGRIASSWYSATSMTIDVNISGGQSHDLSIYALDWDRQNRSERFDLIDPTTNTVLNSQTLSSFSGGTYLTWKISGHVQIKVTSLAGPNAVVSGLFFGPAT